jgi:putative peptidoglycan lipid II flippase
MSSPPKSADQTGKATRRPGASVMRSSAIYSGLTMISRVMGFLRDLVITYRMGASSTIAADCYNTALAFPNLFRRIFAEGAFATAFVPAYSRSLAKDGEEVADILAADAMATLAAATIVITVGAQLAMPWLMYVISPGFAQDPVKFKLAVTLTQIAMPYLPCMAIYAHLSGVLQARGRFIVSALAPTLLNLVMLVVVWPQSRAVDAAYAASFGVIIAGVLQAALLWWGVRKSGARVDVRLPRLTPEIKALIGLAIPGAIAASATQINIFISSMLASLVPGGKLWLAAADRLYQLPLGLVGVAIGVALLPRLSTTVQSGDQAGAQDAMDEAMALSLAFSLPAAAALVGMPYFLIDALFTRGEFTAYDAQQTAAALFWYGLGTPAFVLTRILNQAFFARQDTTSPMRFALISVAVNILAGVGLFFAMHGVAGIAAATALAAWLNVGQMLRALLARGHYAPSAAAVSRLVRVTVASAILTGLLYVASQTRGLYEPYLLHRKEIAVVAAVAAGAVVYLLLLFALRALTVREIRAALRRSPRSADAISDNTL